MTVDEVTDLTRDWLWNQRTEEPHKGGWLVLDCWVDEHSYDDHAVTCADCRANALKETTR